MDPRGGRLHKILLTKQFFEKYEIDYMLCVLTNPLVKEAKKVFRFIKDQKIKHMQFIPCLDDMDTKIRSSCALMPKRFASFYYQIFNLWYQELVNGNYISIKLFGDPVNLLIQRQTTACGKCVIEADGSIYPCDFYVSDDYRVDYI